MKGYKPSKKVIDSSKQIISFDGAIRIDVPVWFGKLNAKKKYIIYGLEPRDTREEFNLERIDNIIFATPFGIDRWNDNSKIPKGKPQIKYYKTFKNFIIDKNKFILFSDIVKDYKVINKNDKKANDKNARKVFNEKINDWKAFTLEEINIVNPDKIIILGIRNGEVAKRIFKETEHLKKLVVVRHPSYGGLNETIKMLENIQ